MGVSELRSLTSEQDITSRDLPGYAKALVDAGLITPKDASLAQMVEDHCDTSLGKILHAEGLVNENDVLSVHARILGAEQFTSTRPLRPADTGAEIDPRQLLKYRAAPVMTETGQTFLAMGAPSTRARLVDKLPESVLSLPVAVAADAAIQDVVARHNRTALTGLAQTRVALSESCRSWSPNPSRRVLGVAGALLCIFALTLLFPSQVFGFFVGWAAFTLIVAALLRVSAYVAHLSRPMTPPADPPRPGARLPKVSVLVPLFRETEVAHALVTRLSRLTYPKSLLEVVLVLEEEDETTRKTLAGIDLPPWMRAVTVPDGQPRTKPRAMNYALDFCHGDIIGIFDAEDAPDPDQITVVARRFQQAPGDVACLQGILDYYNPKQNWLARCFTIEYATWFRVMLPGLARLGFAIPLGGTTVFFRRDALEKLGGWDAHNVTEDADLGFRLARHGYRTEMVGTVTGEEANCHFWPWVKQRSRWLKGYMTTYLVHMRSPRLLHRQLGAWKFWGFQAHFITALSQFILAPFLWTFWLVLLGLPHPLDPLLPRVWLMSLGKLFLAVEVINILIFTTAVAGRFHRHLLPWTPLMHFYTPLGTIAAYKALYEMVFKPFFWDKTQHGLSLTGQADRSDATGSKGAVNLAGIQLEARHKRL
ncbi:glycosyltransferase [Roseovarius sp. C7]|uniref:glycosyltransferase n=1 Tax=Roseovarius sp. C7 TaxID=3398643 RepID=UPI0039F732A2